jgi:hypothetical protein
MKNQFDHMVGMKSAEVRQEVEKAGYKAYIVPQGILHQFYLKHIHFVFVRINGYNGFSTTTSENLC